MEIIPGLPNEISRECLVRVPYTSHYKLTFVCKSWESVVTSPQFYESRKKCGASQELIVLMVRVEAKDDYTIKIYDPLQKSIETLPDIPLHHTYFSHCVFVNHKLFVMGFHSREELLLIYDSSYARSYKKASVIAYCPSRSVVDNDVSGRWKRGADLPDRRRGFGCCVDAGKELIYIAGGHGFSPEVQFTAAFYNVEEDKWKYLPRMNWSAQICHGAFVDDKLYVVEGNNNCAAVECYDRITKIWRQFANFGSSICYPPLPAFGRLFCACMTGVLEFECAENRFDLIETQNPFTSVETQYPDFFTVKGITMWQNQIVICGNNSLHNDFRVYLFKPGEVGREETWTLLDRWSSEELDDVLKCCGTLTL